MTFTEDVARWLEPFLDEDLPGGLYHACNAGGCSWHEYGQHALDFAARAGLPLKARTAEPIPLSALKAFVAPRPPHTVMSTAKLTAVTGAAPRPWQEALNEYLGRSLPKKHLPILKRSESFSRLFAIQQTAECTVFIFPPTSGTPLRLRSMRANLITFLTCFALARATM